MTNTTAIDVTDKAPTGRVVGKMWPCPDWCNYDDVTALPPSLEPKSASFAILQVMHYGHLPTEGDVSVGVGVTDVVSDDGQILRDHFVTIRVGGEDMGLGAALDLRDALNAAIAVAEGDLNRQLRDRGLATEDQLT